MQEWINSLFKGVNERLTSPLYGTLLIATIIWNYDIFLTIFFVDNEAILKITGDKFIKSTYIHDILFPTVFGRNLLECIHPLFAYSISIIWRILPVFALTWLFIEIVPILADWAHKKEREFMFKRETGNMTYERDIALEKAKLLNAEKKKIDAEVKKEAAVKKLKNLKPTSINEKSQEEIWNKEYETFKSSYPGILEKFLRVMYEQDGYTHNYINLMGGNKSDLLKPTHLFGLIKDNNANPIQSTEKGKYFLKRNEQEKNT